MISTVVQLTRNVQELALTVLPHGGQRSSRQNAWASMSSDAVRARARRDAEAAMDRAVLQATAREHAGAQRAAALR